MIEKLGACRLFCIPYLIILDPLFCIPYLLFLEPLFAVPGTLICYSKIYVFLNRKVDVSFQIKKIADISDHQ